MLRDSSSSEEDSSHSFSSSLSSEFEKTLRQRH